MVTNRQFLIFINRVIQQSHPVCNTIMLFGVITCLISVILLGIDGQFVDSETYPKVSWGNQTGRKMKIDDRSRPAQKSIASNGILMNWPILFAYQSSFILDFKSIRKGTKKVEGKKENFLEYFKSFSSGFSLGLFRRFHNYRQTRRTLQNK